MPNNRQQEIHFISTFAPSFKNERRCFDSSPRQDVDCRGMLSKLSSNKKNIGSRSAADIETQLTQLLFQTQESHEEIILEVFDFRPGTEYGYNHPCERELQQHEIDARRAEQRYYELHPEECKG